MDNNILERLKVIINNDKKLEKGDKLIVYKTFKCRLGFCFKKGLKGTLIRIVKNNDQPYLIKFKRKIGYDGGYTWWFYKDEINNFERM